MKTEWESIDEEAGAIASNVVEEVTYFCCVLSDDPPCRCLSGHIPSNTSISEYELAEIYLKEFNQRVRAAIATEKVWNIIETEINSQLEKAYEEECKEYEESEEDGDW